MKFTVHKLSPAIDMDMCRYQLMVYDTFIEIVNHNNQSVLQPREVHISILAEIKSTDYSKLLEGQFVRLFKTCLTEYKNLNSTIRLDQLLVNLNSITREYRDYVNFRPM